MGRVIRNWTPIDVATAPVASHRYTRAGTVDKNGAPVEGVDCVYDYLTARSCIPYHIGDVVYVLDCGKAVRALICNVALYVNHDGDWRERYGVQPETKGGLFSKVWAYTYPGPIQRGYEEALHISVDDE